MAFAIATKFTAIDLISGPIAKIQKRFNTNIKAMSRGADRFNRGLNKLGGGAASALGAAGVAGGIAGVTLAMRSAITTGIEFEQTIVNAAAKFGGTADRGTVAFNNLQTAAEQAGRTTVFTATEAAQGLNFLAMAGFNVEQSIAALPGVINLAISTQTDLATATDIASDALGAFGLASDDAEQNAAGLTKVLDVMATTTTTANTDMERMFTTIKVAAPTFTAAGQSIETFSALTGILANSGIKGSRAGTALRASVVRLQKVTPEAAKWMNKLGVSIADGDGNMRDMFDILGDLEAGMKGMGEVQKGTALATIFGTEAVSALNVIMAEGNDGLRKYRDHLTQVEGANAKMAKTMGDTTGGALKTMFSAIEGLQLKLFDLNKGPIRDTIESFTVFTNSITTAIEANENFAVALSGEFFTAVKAGGQLIVGLTATLVGVKVAVFAFQAGLVVARGVMLAWAAATKILVAAQWLLNVALTANPIGLIVVGVTALIGLGTALILAWGPVTDFFDSLFGGIVDWLDFIISPISQLIDSFGIIGRLVGGVIDGNTPSQEASERAGPSAAIVSPQARQAAAISETVNTNRTEVTVSAAQGTTATQTGPKTPGVTVANSGGR